LPDAILDLFNQEQIKEVENEESESTT
ncbi:hypothetical protein MNBD_BACTEROID04-1689, partial [hydrothermal vent metagenome]